MKNKIIILLAVILLLSAGSASARPGIYIAVEPINDNVKAGEIAKYTVKVHTTPDVTDTENVHLYIESPLPGWDYIFTPNDFDIHKDPDVQTSILEVHVPPGTDSAIYTKWIKASTTYGDVPDWETADFTTYVNVNLPPPPVPELSTMTLISIGIFGMLLVSRKYRGT